MLLLDMSQLLHASLYELPEYKKTYDEAILRHLILNKIRENHIWFPEYQKDTVLAFDGGSSWRKRIFPYYKHKRKKAREDSDTDWNTVYRQFDAFTEEFKENLPYKVMHIQSVEGDDIIGVLTRLACSENRKVMIVSSDKDFKQLHNPLVKQWSPLLKKPVTVDSASVYLREQLLTGDAGDGIPNFMMPDDFFVVGVGRQKSVTAGLKEKYASTDPDDPVQLANLERNKNLIDLDRIPDDIKEKILDLYSSTTPNPRRKILSYFIQKGVRNLMDSVNDF